MSRYLFLCRNLFKEEKQSTNAARLFKTMNLTYEIVSPSFFAPTVRELPLNRLTLGMWIIYARLFLWRTQGKTFEIHVLRCGNLTVHYSVVLPKFFRFPFMGRNDIEIGPCWTHPEYRGRGIYPIMLQEICSRFSSTKDVCWIFCEEENRASVRGIGKGGFRMIGHGRRTAPMGLALFGRFVIESTTTEVDESSAVK